MTFRLFGMCPYPALGVSFDRDRFQQSIDPDSGSVFTAGRGEQASAEHDNGPQTIRPLRRGQDLSKVLRPMTKASAVAMNSPSPCCFVNAWR